MDDQPQFNVDDQEQVKPKVDDLIKQELQRLMALSKKYRDMIDGAKTEPKRNLYSKKLKKNNLKLMNIMVALEKLKADVPEESAGETEWPAV